MLIKKILLNTFGAKIAPYGFEYQGFRHNRWTFSREIDGQTQRVVIQRDIHGDKSFRLELPRGLVKTYRLMDLEYHSYKDDDELEDILNLLGDHFVRRVIPELSKPEEKRPEYTITRKMYNRLEREKDGLAGQFMDCYGLDWENGTDGVMGKLLLEVENIKGKPFGEVSGKAVELAAVSGEALIRETGGEWMKEVDGNGLERMVIGNLVYENGTIDPLRDIGTGWREGGAWVIECFLRRVREYREWVGKNRGKYGNGWQPPRLAEVNEGDLLDGKVVKETVGKKMEDLGFVYMGGKFSRYRLEREREGKRMIIIIERDEAGRRAFSATLYWMEGNRMGRYLYRGFRFYRDAGDMRVQLGCAGAEIREALQHGKPLKDTWKIPSFRYHLTREDKKWLREEREEITEKFRKEYGLKETSAEEEILSCLAKRLDVLKSVDYGECREELLAMAAVLGDLVIREMGGIGTGMRTGGCIRWNSGWLVCLLSESPYQRK